MDVETWDWWESWQDGWHMLTKRWEQVESDGGYPREADILWAREMDLERQWEEKMIGYGPRYYY